MDSKSKQQKKKGYCSLFSPDYDTYEYWSETLDTCKMIYEKYPDMNKLCLDTVNHFYNLAIKRMAELRPGSQ